MRYIRLFSIYFQDAFEQRSRSFVWFLMSLFGPLVMVLFWKGAAYQHTQWTFSTVSTYYFLLIIASAFLMSHPEEWIAEDHIHNGNLGQFLLRPFPYFWSNFMSELPWRIIQGFFGVVVIVLFYFLFKNVVVLSLSFPSLLVAICIALLGYFLGFIYKMTLAMLAFWFTEMGGIFQVSDILLFTFAGYIGPFFLFPDLFSKIAMVLPFSYMIYFPILVFEGKVDFLHAFGIICVQLMWILIFSCMYKLLWKTGLKKFAAVGQ